MQNSNTSTSDNKTLKVFAMSDCEWWADYTMDEAVRAYSANSGFHYACEGDYPIELSDDELKTKMIVDEAGGEVSYCDALQKISSPQMFHCDAKE